MYEINLFKLKLIFVFFESLYKPYKIEKELNIMPLLIMETELKKVSRIPNTTVKLKIFLNKFISKNKIIEIMELKPNNSSHFKIPDKRKL